MIIKLEQTGLVSTKSLIATVNATTCWFGTLTSNHFAVE
jgi:hypothetical protein